MNSKSQTNQAAPEIRVPFGKSKGRLLSECPDGLLKRCVVKGPIKFKYPAIAEAAAVLLLSRAKAAEANRQTEASRQTPLPVETARPSPPAPVPVQPAPKLSPKPTRADNTIKLKQKAPEIIKGALARGLAKPARKDLPARGNCRADGRAWEQHRFNRSGFCVQCGHVRRPGERGPIDNACSMN